MKPRMVDESVNISDRTWIRSVHNIRQVGYSDGVTDGLNTSFQTSFDIGYFQGFEFGLDLGHKLANENQSELFSKQGKPLDTRNINCQICLDQTTISQNVVNLYNIQKEKNYLYLINK